MNEWPPQHNSHLASPRYPRQPPPPPDTAGRKSDLIFGTITGLLSAGVKALWAIGLVLVTRSAGTGPGSLDMGRMAVYGFLCLPFLFYISLTSAYGASALWTGAPGGRWFGRPEIRGLLRAVPADEITLAQAAGRGALGGALGLASVSILLIAWLVICLFMVFLGPGPAILVLWLGVVLGALAICAAWGAVIGSLIFCRRRFGWPVGLAVAFVMIVVLNLIIGRII